MRQRLYFKIALNNLSRHRRLYLPHILTGAGLTAMFYIVLTLSMDNQLGAVRGGRYLPTIMKFGAVIIAILSLVLMLYTNSFLIKQRQREFGLYNVLGMEKRHIGRILFFETLFSGAAAVFCGQCAGIALYKIFALLICRILKVPSVLGFYHVSHRTVIPSIVFFAALYLLIYCVNRIQLSRLNPTQLLFSSFAGEKEPATKRILLIAGLISLSSGYFLAWTAENPLKALTTFFGAALLVIVGTYCLFTAGSIAFLKLLKRTPGYYYHPRHMTAVSGLLYRMKQNAVGLASVCILSTGVLVMLSTTVSLYAGIEDILISQYPHDLSVSASYDVVSGEGGTETKAVPQSMISEAISHLAEDMGISVTCCQEETSLSVTYRIKDGGFSTDEMGLDGGELPALATCTFMTAQEYEKLTGIPLALAEDEIACYPYNDDRYLKDALSIDRFRFSVAQTLSDFPVEVGMYSGLSSCFGIVVGSEDVFNRIYEGQNAAYAIPSDICRNVVFDFDAEDAALYEFYNAAERRLRDILQEQVAADPDAEGSRSYSWNCRLDQKEYCYGMYGTLLFLGLILTLIFLFATVLIIYYKQISEGYEDYGRFRIMQQVGMSQQEIKATIRSQVLLVFFLPLLTAAIHLAATFPILTKLLRIFFLPNPRLFLGCAGVTLAAFTLIYVAIYALTSKTYYKLVSR